LVLVLSLVSLFVVPTTAASRFDIQTFTKNSIVRDTVTPVQLQLESGWKILGGGASAESVASECFVTAAYPVDVRTWYVRVTTGAFNLSSDATLYVNAIYDPQDELDHKIVIVHSELSTHPKAAATVDAGYILTGGGVLDESITSGNFIVATYPATTTTWLVQGKDHISGEPTQFFAYAIGIKPKNASVHITSSIHSVASASLSAASATVYPPTSYGQVSGGGASVAYTGAGNLIWRTIPVLNVLDKPIGWTAASHDEKIVDRATITTYAVALRLQY